MIENFVLALCTLMVVLYFQARRAARRIRRQRSNCRTPLRGDLVLKRRV